MFTYNKTIWIIFGGPYIPMLIFFMAILNILRTIGIFYGHLGYFMTICYIHYVLFKYIFSGFGIMYKEKSGNPAVNTKIFAPG
jgi:hypothetical protein